MAAVSIEFMWDRAAAITLYTTGMPLRNECCQPTGCLAKLHDQMLRSRMDKNVCFHVVWGHIQMLSICSAMQSNRWIFTSVAGKHEAMGPGGDMIALMTEM